MKNQKTTKHLNRIKNIKKHNITKNQRNNKRQILVIFLEEIMNQNIDKNEITTKVVFIIKDLGINKIRILQENQQQEI